MKKTASGLLTALACALLAGTSSVRAAEVTYERLLNPDKEPHNWLMHHRDLGSQRHSPLEVLNDPLLHASGALVKLSHPSLGGLEAVGMGLPIQFSKTQSQFDQPAQALGEANEEIYKGLLKLGEEDLARLRADRVI